MRRLGSTDIAAVCALYEPQLASALPKNKTACDVFNRLTWGFEPRKTAPMTRGNDMEPIALDYYRQHVGPAWRPALAPGEWWTVADPLNPDLTASPDALDREHQPRIVIEAKAWSEAWGRAHWGEPGTDRMATRFLYQCQWLMARTRAHETHVLVLFGNDIPVDDPEPGEPKSFFQITEPAIYRTTRDDDFCARLDAHAERFLSEFVRPGIPPPVKSAHHRRAMKAKLHEQASDAVEEWERRCVEHAATNNTDELGRPRGAAASVAGDEAGGGHGMH
jgi:YqaJ-like viral recombinase domain